MSYSKKEAVQPLFNLEKELIFGIIAIGDS